MYPYWLLFLIWAAGAVQAERRRTHDPRFIAFAAASTFTALMIGLRFEVGGDWGSYQLMYERIYFLTLGPALGETDPAYAAANWLAAQIGFGVPAVNMLCAALFMGGVARLAWRQPNPALAILVAVPYLIIVVAMGYTRQAAAIGIICFAIADLSERHLVRLVFLIALATLFHKTAALVLPIALVPIFRRNALFGIAGAVAFVLLAWFALGGSSDRLITNYVQGDYDSQGAAVRVAMNLLAASLFFVFRRRFDIPPFQKSLWTLYAVISVVSVAALFLASASSGIDRLSLYIIPLQMIVYSRLPYILGQNGRSSVVVLLAVLGYCFLVQFVWLNYADNALYWLPYGTVLLPPA